MARLFVEQLTVIDCAWLHSQRGLLGESWLVDLELKGQLDFQGMVLDFGRLKPRVKAVVDDTVDHRLLVPARSGALRLERSRAEVELWYDYDGARLYHRSPPEALCLLDVSEIDIAAVESYLAAEVRRVMPENVEAARVTLRPERIGGASYRYVHGLEQHQGNCQRIAHGHRSRIEVYRDEQRSESCERWLAERWRDVYIGTRDHLIEETRLRETPCYRFRYHAPQGDFELIIDKRRCELLDTESTIENIAASIARLMKRRDPAASFRVRAYEGVRKGAIAEA